jgi:hypothetical protein
MRKERTSRERRPPTRPTQTFVIYEKKSGALRGIHHVFGGPPVGDKVLTPEKLRRASKALASSVTKRTASMGGLSPAALASLELKAPMPRGAEAMRVDPAGRRLVPKPPAAGAKLSKLVRPSRRARRSFPVPAPRERAG